MKGSDSDPDPLQPMITLCVWWGGAGMSKIVMNKLSAMCKSMYVNCVHACIIVT